MVWKCYKANQRHKTCSSVSYSCIYMLIYMAVRTGPMVLFRMSISLLLTPPPPPPPCSQMLKHAIARGCYLVFNPFYCHDVIWKQPIKAQHLKPLSLCVFFFTLACEKVSIKMHSTEKGCYRTGKYTVCRGVCTSFSLESLQAGAVMGLIKPFSAGDENKYNAHVSAVEQHHSK